MIATMTMHSMPSRGKNISKTSNCVSKWRPRKVVQSVDTNLNSYDRTDPFLAFNVLLKLIGSLPSRVGGCQYKLTPEEHKLSLHLLTIVEPFVGLAPSRRTITRQPTEILDSIVFYIDSKADLLSFGLSCQRMHSIVFPRHFNYRAIRCKVSSVSVWNHLIVHRSLARNVRRLEILDERSPEPITALPGLLTPDADLDSSGNELGLHAKHERYLVGALTEMTALQSFSWSCNHSPISIDNVWPTLLECQSLTEVEINDNLLFSKHSEGTEAVGSNALVCRPMQLPELKTVTLRSTKHTYGSTRNPSLSRISGMLEQCPNLEALCVAYSQPRSIPGCTHPPVDDFLLGSHWPNLTTLSLTNLQTSGFEAAAAFLSVNLKLEVLHLDILGGGRGAGGRLVLPHNSLPFLRELKSNQVILNAVLECQCDPPRPLETIKGLRWSGSNDPSGDQDRALVANLKKYGKTLKRIELMGWSEMDDIRRLADCVPGLSWLDVGKKNWGTNAPFIKDKFIPVFNTMEWANLLSAFPELTAFHGVRFFYSTSDTPSVRKTDEMSASDRSRIRKNDEIAFVLAWKCPKLRRVDYWEEGVGRVIVLVRDTGASGNGVVDREKVKWEVKRVKL